MPKTSKNSSEQVKVKHVVHDGTTTTIYQGIQLCTHPGKPPRSNCMLALVPNEDAIDLWWLHGLGCVAELVRYYREQESWVFAAGASADLEMYIVQPPQRIKTVSMLGTTGNSK